MARPGRQPTSIEQHRAAGTLRKDRHATTPLVTGRRVRPKCPPEITGKARDVFNLIITDLWKARILDRSDTTLVICAALHLATALEAQELVQRLGTCYPVTRGAYNGQPGYKVMEANPAVKVARDSMIEYRMCCDQLGIGPAARARLANMGVKGATPAQALPGIGARPTPLRIVNGDDE